MDKQLKLKPLRLLIMLTLLPISCHAYIDSGTGAYLVQALMTIGGAAILFVRDPIGTIKAWWKSRRRGSNE